MSTQTRQSSCVAGQSYDANEQALTVNLASGSTYTYRQVSPALYAQFISAESLGRAYNTLIRPLGGQRAE